jgi:leucyl aminopeptidase (aminopeptidase T)
MSPMKLKKACTHALKDMMEIDPSETVLVLSDENMTELGLTLYESAKKLCEEAFYMEMKPRMFDGEEPPEQVVDMMKFVDVIVAPTTKSIAHTKARKKAEKLGVRIATMPSLSLESFWRCIYSDTERIQNTNDRLIKKLKEGNEIRLQTDSGTDLVFPIMKDTIENNNGELNYIGAVGDLPGGYISAAPVEGKAQGKIIVDTTIAVMGKVKNPFYVEVQDGYGVNFTGKGGEAKVFPRFLKKGGDDGYVLSEFGIGTNPNAKWCGELFEDQKVPGAVYLAFGNNFIYGGKSEAPLHVGLVLGRCSVFVDDEQVVAYGKIIV